MLKVNVVCIPLPVNLSTVIAETGCGIQLKFPLPSVLITYPLLPPVIFKLPTFDIDNAFTVALLAEILPDTVKFDKVPTLVILGCEFVYTVPAINAFATCPETLATATEFAVVA